MSKRNVVLIAAAAVGIALILMVPSVTIRAVGAALVMSLALVYLVRASRHAPTEPENTGQPGPSAEALGAGTLFEATIGGMREGLLIVDEDMRVVALNPAAHGLFNPGREPLARQRLTDLTRNPAVYDAFLDALNGTERSGVKVQTHGPERLVFDLRVVPLRDLNGKSGDSAQGALGVFIDVTRIERLEQVRQEFLSNVSHELRTPLTAILAFVETLESADINDHEARQRFFPIIRRNALRMQDLIDDILELSAIEAGNVPVRAEKVDLYPIVNEVISSLAAKAAVSRIALNNAVAPGATAYADARRLEQMLTNLVDNAIKFNREDGKVTITHETSSTTDKIKVADTGEGIPAQHLERLFERFYRVDRARSREMGGTGLGLAIVKHLALAHAGEITVSSQLGRGTTFTIELPRHLAVGNNSQ